MKEQFSFLAHNIDLHSVPFSYIYAALLTVQHDLKADLHESKPVLSVLKGCSE